MTTRQNRHIVFFVLFAAIFLLSEARPRGDTSPRAFSMILSTAGFSFLSPEIFETSPVSPR
jgi:hypothetical protein